MMSSSGGNDGPIKFIQAFHPHAGQPISPQRIARRVIRPPFGQDVKFSGLTNDTFQRIKSPDKT